MCRQGKAIQNSLELQLQLESEQEEAIFWIFYFADIF